MKQIIISSIVGVLCFAAGCAAGWMARKKTEVQFEEVTEEELYACAEEDMNKKGKKEDNLTDEPQLLSSSKTQHETIDTQKTAYWDKYKNEAGKYKLHSELAKGEEPVITEEEPPELDTEEELVIDDIPDKNVPHVEESDEDEFEYWLGEPDGEYQAMEVNWFSGDDVLTDEDNDPISNHQRYLGFDPKKEFAKMGVKRDVQAVLYRKNNLLQIIYKVVQYPSSFGKRRFVEEYGGNDQD